MKALARSTIAGQTVPVELDASGCYSLLKDEKGTPVILGHGAWGPVHKAFNSDLRCYAALKIIAQSAFESDEERERFVSEARLAAQIRHPSLASVFPLGLIADQYLYATEYVDGETLNARLMRDGCLGMLPTLRIMCQITTGLEVASSAGLLHRNISAESVMLLQEDEEISAKVLDLALPVPRPQENDSTQHHLCEFSSPEECGGKGIDERSGVYSLGAILYYALAGAEKYELFRAKSLANEQVSFEDIINVVPQVAVILKSALYYNPGERIATLAELRDAIDEVLRVPRRVRSEVVAQSEQGDYAGATVDLPCVESSRDAAAEKNASPSAKCGSVATLKAGGVTIPPRLLGSAKKGTVLVLSREGVTNEHLIVCARNRFRIGRSASAGADLATRFLPRNSANDTKTKRLSRIHVTAKCENGQVFLLDGDGITPSANGSTFDGRILSAEAPLALLKSGDLRLAEVYSIRIVPRTFEHRDALSIANLDDWTGPDLETNPPAVGAVVFVPAELNKTRIAVWLFSEVAFGSGSTSPLDFALQEGSREIGALRYYRGCFWIEPKSADAVSVDSIALAPAEIAPLVTGQVIEIGGAKFSVKIDDVSDVR